MFIKPKLIQYTSDMRLNTIHIYRILDHHKLYLQITTEKRKKKKRKENEL